MKALAGWTARQCNETRGGIPPNLGSITTSPSLVTPFVNALFGGDIETRWPMNIRRMLTASLLRYYKEFLTILEWYPEDAHTTKSDHPFVNAVEEAMNVTGVSDELFNSWCKEVNEGFQIANYQFIPRQFLTIQTTQVDPRSLYEHLQNQIAIQNSHLAQKMKMQEEIHQLRLENTQLIQSNLRNEKTLTMVVDQLSKTSNTLQIKFNTSPPASPSRSTSSEQPSEDAPISLMPFSEIYKKYKLSTLPIDDLFQNFFRYRCMEAHTSQLKTPSYKALLSGEKKKIRDAYKRLKKAIKTMLFFCERCPTPIPSNQVNLTKWYKELARTAQTAVSGLAAAIEKAEGPTKQKLNIAFFQKSKLVKEWDDPKSTNALSLPPDTPDHFKD